MKLLMFAIAVSSALAAPAQALSPAAEAFVRKVGLDPASAAVRLADKDGTITTLYQDDEKKYSLESLALEGAKNGVKLFVTTRGFIHKLKTDYARTPFPTAGYDGLYLTVEERKLAMRKMVEN